MSHKTPVQTMKDDMGVCVRSNSYSYLLQPGQVATIAAGDQVPTCADQGHFELCCVQLLCTCNDSIAIGHHLCTMDMVLSIAMHAGSLPCKQFGEPVRGDPQWGDS